LSSLRLAKEQTASQDAQCERTTAEGNDPESEAVSSGGKVYQVNHGQAPLN